MFSFNSSRGQCECCRGLGFIDTLDPDKILDAPTLPLDEQASLVAYLENDDLLKNKILTLLKKNKYSFETPLSEMNMSFLDLLINGKNGSFIGILPYFTNLTEDSDFESLSQYDAFFTLRQCEECEGKRLKPYPLAFKYLNNTIDIIVNLSINNLNDFF